MYFASLLENSLPHKNIQIDMTGSLRIQEANYWFEVKPSSTNRVTFDLLLI